MAISVTANNNTKQRILQAAEQLFAETGVGSTSLRNITAAAHVNLAAVNYHFGSKDSLIEAVYERRLAPLNRARLANLEALEAENGGGALPVDAIVNAFVEPVATLSDEPEDGPVFTRLIAQTYSEASQYVHKLLSTEHQDVMRRYKGAFHRALPELSNEEVCWRLHFMAGALHHTLADTSYLRWFGQGNLSPEVSVAIRQLVPFLVAGICAPPAPRGNA